MPKWLIATIIVGFLWIVVYGLMEWRKSSKPKVVTPAEEIKKRWGQPSFAAFEAIRDTIVEALHAHNQTLEMKDGFFLIFPSEGQDPTSLSPWMTYDVDISVTDGAEDDPDDPKVSISITTNPEVLCPLSIRFYDSVYVIAFDPNDEGIALIKELATWQMDQIASVRNLRGVH